jgi:hypothetical protein
MIALVHGPRLTWLRPQSPTDGLLHISRVAQHLNTGPADVRRQDRSRAVDRIGEADAMGGIASFCALPSEGGGGVLPNPRARPPFARLGKRNTGVIGVVGTAGLPWHGDRRRPPCPECRGRGEPVRRTRNLAGAGYRRVDPADRRPQAFARRAGTGGLAGGHAGSFTE